MLVFYFFGALVIWLGILSLRNGFAFSKYVRRELASPLPDFTPFVSVIAPCRGLDEGFEENISALFHQGYPQYEIIFVTDKADDPALSVIETVREQIADLSWHELAYPDSKRVVAGPAQVGGQKVQNLREAVLRVDQRCEVLVFVDTDARPHERWLRSLVAPLSDETVGAATGYRWFVPEAGGFASQLRAVWNASIASALGARRDRNFCWGGSTAIRKSTFEKLRVAERWRGSVSDDFTLTRVLQEAKLPIHFVPACLVASFDHCRTKELFEFTNRQLKITRAYAPHLWKPLLIGSLLFCSVFFGGVALVTARIILGLDYAFPLLMLLSIFVLGAAKAYIRLSAVAVSLSAYERLPLDSVAAHLFLWPLASALYLANAIIAAGSRRISWRGITYDLKSPDEAVIIGREE